VHYWADLQSGHGLRCYGNITRTLVTSLRPSSDMTTIIIIIIQHLYSALKSCKGYGGAGGFRLRLSEQCERPAGRDLRALLDADWRVTGAFSKLRAVYEKWARLARR